MPGPGQAGGKAQDVLSAENQPQPDPTASSGA